MGKNSPDVAAPLLDLGDLYRVQGLYARAEPLLQRALALYEEVYGKDSEKVASTLDSLGSLYREQGLYARAEPLLERAVALFEMSLGQGHFRVADSLNHLARLRLAQGRLAEALPLRERTFTASEQHLRQEVFGFSEARLTNALNLLRAEEELLYSLAHAHPGDARVWRLALSSALLRKGRSVEEITDISRIVSRSLDKADRESFERLRALRAQQATLSLNGPGRMAPADYQQRLVELTAQSDSLEADLAQRSAPLRALTALPSPAGHRRPRRRRPPRGLQPLCAPRTRARQPWPSAPPPSSVSSSRIAPKWPISRQEAEALRRLLPQAQVFLGRDASKERLLRLTTPGILHIATHGFFLEDAATAPQGARGVATSGPLGGEGPAPALPDPLLRSGLVLADARAPSASSGEAPSRRLDDSLVTALELSGLNLWGTELVVLSACDTGRGDVKLGQGVYGLRRALVVAGAETLVMSLWKVNDETTHSLGRRSHRYQRRLDANRPAVWTRSRPRGEGPGSTWAPTQSNHGPLNFVTNASYAPPGA